MNGCARDPREPAGEETTRWAAGAFYDDRSGGDGTIPVPERRRTAGPIANAPVVDVYQPEGQPPAAALVAVVGTARTMNRCGAGPTW
jgi:hypothetical protein